MPNPALSGILRAMCRAAEGLQLSGLRDPDLLLRFTAERDEAAFRALLVRHGPMVLAICRSLLPSEADAEDAFQVTFLVLAHKAGSVSKAASLASWLRAVAYRTATKARAEFARQRGYERQAAVGRESAPDDLTWRDVQRVL